MAVIGLNLPTDIAWELVCVTDDMMATRACEARHPPKWRSSIAVSRYVPEDDYQVYPGRKITYLKVTCTIAGYQPRAKEVEGRIDYGGVSLETIDDLDSLLDAYLPCTGALVQVAVSPRGGASGDLPPISEYPYFMDFQPKKRELYEMVTDTGERSSRSTVSLAVGKAAGTSESLEVLDVDQGGSSGGSVGVSYMGAGVSGSYQQSTQGQWGTKQLGAQQSSVSRSTDESRERRETESHTTQLSQMYHLLDSYHQGTNRALFFVQPRPHILEVPTGFVRGPRDVDGIQEFFLIVNQPKDQGGFEVSVRLDTSHLTVVPIMDYDRSRRDTVTCKAVADLPTRDAPPDAPMTTGLQDGDGDRVGTIYYDCFKREAHSVTPYTPPAGYRIDVDNDGGYLDQVNTAIHGSSSVDVDSSGESLTVRCDATSHVCKYRYFNIDLLYNPPDNVEDDNYKWAASSERDVLVYLISREPTVQTGEKTVLLVTSRELCCGGVKRIIHAGIVDVVSLVNAAGSAAVLPKARFAAVAGRVRAAGIAAAAPRASAAGPIRGAAADRGEPPPSASGASAERKPGDGARAPVPGPPTMMARDANALSDAIRDAMLRSAGARRREGAAPVPYVETDLFHTQLRRKLVQTAAGRKLLRRPAMELIERDVVEEVARGLGLPAAQLTVGRVSDLAVQSLSELAGVDSAEARRIRLACLGVPLRREPPPDAPRAGRAAKVPRRR